MSQIVWFFDKPTIGFCPECEVTAIWHEGLMCPNSRDHEISIFVWTGEGPFPE